VVNKYGKDNIKIEILECFDEEDSFRREKQLISILRGQGYQLANICDGGEGFSGRTITEGHKRKISEANKGNQYAKGRKRSEEFKENLRNKGQTEEQKLKNSIANKGRNKPTRTASHKENISLAMKGKPWSLLRREAQTRKKEEV
jgi:hypothetical protein